MPKKTAPAFPGSKTSTEIIEKFVEARDPRTRGADRLVLGPTVFGVVDGSTAKPWISTNSPSGGDIADALLEVLGGLGPEVGVREAIARVTDRVHALMPEGVPARRRSCATMTVLVPGRSEIWRVGEQWVLMDGVACPAHRAREDEVAARRAAALARFIADGSTIAELVLCDRGREAVIKDLERLEGFRNAPAGDGFGALDGSTVPDAYIEVIPIGHAREVVIASDGYPQAGKTLAVAEESLRARIERDPLMMEEPPATKGLGPGLVSYDDRSYLRLRLDRRDA